MRSPAQISSIQIRWQSPVFDPSGYADEARYFLREVQAHVPIRLEPIGRFSKEFQQGMDPKECAALQDLMAVPLSPERLQLSMAPAYALQRDPRAQRAIGRTMFETDRLPADWVAACNRMDEIWVPTDFNVETFRRAGVTVPLHIVPGGVDPKRFYPGLTPLEIAGRRRFAFLSVFEWIYRKGWDVLLRAWAETFAPDEDVCLLIRSYLPNTTEGASSVDAINRRIDEFYTREMGRARDTIAPVIVLGEQLAQLDMPRLYATADAFVLPTRGEGWGRPFIEAMACGLPVIGTRWSGQLAFMNDSNALLLETEGLETIGGRMEFPMYRGHHWARPSTGHLKDLMRRTFSDPEASQRLGRTASVDVHEKWGWFRAGAVFQERLQNVQRHLGTTAAKSLSAQSDPVTVSWEGSFLDFGSLSHVNREMTRQLERNGGVRLTRVDRTSTASGGHPVPELSGKLSADAPAEVSVTVRHAWPPDWRRPNRGKLVVIQPWEFGVLPLDWVRQSQHVDEFWAHTTFVRDSYIESGIDPAKVKIVPLGIDAECFHPEVAPRALATNKKFKFLFVGGTIGRKGPDVLLNAYLNSFTAADNVCLVIKDFGGQSVYRGQTFAGKIKQAQQQASAPEILYLDQELAPAELPALYTACDCFVLPYRGEGFGLPALEAMACGLPVILTGGGATDDFAGDEVAYRIPSKRIQLTDEISGMKLVAPGWLLEPDAAALAERMKWIIANPEAARAKGEAASEQVRRDWTWSHAAKIVAQRLNELRHAPPPKARGSSPARNAGSMGVPACAGLGNLAKARELFGRKNVEAAWECGLAALSARPFHPEGYLLMAEIAQLAGANATARKCAQRAREMAPGWRAPKQFLQKPHRAASPNGKWQMPDGKDAAPRLTVCVVAKNEEQFIGQCLQSIKAVAHQIVVVDTGSSDRTVEIAKGQGAEVYSFTWCDDFSAARNAALEHATGDWVLMLDADEELPANQHANLLKDMANNEAIAFRVPLVNQGSNDGRNYVPRLFRNAPGVFFRGRIHEQVFPSLLPMCKAWGLETGLGTAELLHHGYSKELVKDRNKIERNLRLLKQAVEEQPKDVNLVMNLGLELVRSGDFSAGLEKYACAFRLMSALAPRDVVPELREVLLTQFTCHLCKNRSFDEVVRVLKSPLASNGGLTASLHYALGLAHYELKQYREAAEQMCQCVAKRNKPALSPINTDILTAAPLHCLALSLAQLGDLEDAEKAFQSAMLEKSRSAEAGLDYAKFLSDQDRHVDALHRLHELVGQDATCAAAWRVGGEIALKRPEFLEFACDWTAEAIRCLPADPAIVAQRAEALLLSQQTAVARPLWDKICNGARPPRALAAVILCAAAESGSVPETHSTAEESAASRAFVEWYQRLISAGAQETVVRLNSRVDALRQSLPTAARLLDLALAEADQK